jgi:hypothetical protein
VTNSRETFANSLLRVVRRRIETIRCGARDVISFSLSVFRGREGCARDSAGAFSCFMFYFNQLFHGETGALDEGPSFIVGVRPAVTEKMSLVLTRSLNGVGR